MHFQVRTKWQWQNLGPSSIPRNWQDASKGGAESARFGDASPPFSYARIQYKKLTAKEFQWVWGRKERRKGEKKKRSREKDVQQWSILTQAIFFLYYFNSENKILFTYESRKAKDLYLHPHYCCHFPLPQNIFPQYFGEFLYMEQFAKDSSNPLVLVWRQHSLLIQSHVVFPYKA